MDRNKDCLLGEPSTMTRIVSNPEDDRSFLMKSMEMKFHGRSGMELFEVSIGLVTLCLDRIQVTQDLQNCCTSAEAGPGVSVAD